MKYVKEYKTFVSPEEKRINDILDKGLSNASPNDLEILKNQGELSRNKKFYEGEFYFDLEKVDDFGDELKTTGILTYNGEKYYGWFTLPKEEQRGENTWDFFQGAIEFDPNSDDLYDLDSMIQEIESEYLDK